MSVTMAAQTIEARFGSMSISDENGMGRPSKVFDAMTLPISARANTPLDQSLNNDSNLV